MSGCVHVESGEPPYARLTAAGVDVATGQPFTAERVECYGCAMRTLEEFDQRLKPGGVINVYLQPEDEAAKPSQLYTSSKPAREWRDPFRPSDGEGVDVIGATAPVGKAAPGYTCPRCGRTSYHPKDLEESYCGACHVFEHG